MAARIGVLLPRSTEYPSMSFDLLEGLRYGLKQLGITDAAFFTENTGFGENAEFTNARAEKLVMQDDVDFIVAYATSLNAEALYAFAETTGKPFLFLDAGMEIFEAPPHRLCYHITLQGLMACQEIGSRAAEGGRSIISSTSFFDGGYRGSWIMYNAIQKAGGSVCANYVSQYQPNEFSLAQLSQLVETSGGQVITAGFSSYFAGLYMSHLAQEGKEALKLPIYCTPFMADEQLLSAIPFPGGTFHTVVPWSNKLDNTANRQLEETIQKEKNKTANIFHLLGWEAALVAQQLIANGISSLDNWSYESPRGTMTFHPGTHNVYGPLYEGNIIAGADNHCALTIGKKIDVDPATHLELFSSRIDTTFSRWKNNFFCI